MPRAAESAPVTPSTDSSIQRKTLSELKTDPAIKPKQEEKNSPVRLKVDLRAKREMAGVSHATAAFNAECSPSMIQTVERGDNVSLAFALKLARFYEQRVEDIWEINPDYKPGK